MSRSLCIFVALVLGACARPLLGPEPDDGGGSGESSGGDSSSTFVAASSDDESDAESEESGNLECHPSYSPCLPIVDDLDCPDLVAMGTGPVTLVGPDDYGLDADGDGIGCEP